MLPLYKQIEEIVIYEDLFGYSWYDAAQKTVLFEGDIQSEIGLIHWTIYSYLILIIIYLIYKLFRIEKHMLYYFIIKVVNHLADFLHMGV